MSLIGVVRGGCALTVSQARDVARTGRTRTGNPGHPGAIRRFCNCDLRRFWPILFRNLQPGAVATTWRDIIIKILEGFPESVVALIAEGQVTRKDYEEVLIPRVNEALARYGKVRLYYELGRSFSGIDAEAAWEDLKIGLEHLSRWERIAVVTDVRWIRLTLNAFRFMMPGRLRVFDADHAADARSWIMGE